MIGNRSAQQRGVTLIELMVGVAIGLFLVTVMGSIFLGSKGSLRSQGHVARLQENARFSVSAISADLRMAGFLGCRGNGTASPVNNVLATPTALLYNFGQGIWVSHHTGSVWSPALPSGAGGLPSSVVPNSNGDVLTIRRSVGAGMALTAEMGSATADLTVTAGSPINKGDWLMVSDCTGAAVFQATNHTPGASGSIQHATGGSLTPGNTSASLAKTSTPAHSGIFLQDALVHRLATVTYYLAPSTRSGKTHLRSLWSHTVPSYDGSVQPQELVTGVERMLVRLGLDSSPATAGDGAVDAYTTADQVTDWSRVVTAQVELLLASTDDQVASVAQPYVFDGASSTPADRRLRSVVSVTASVRNSLR